MPPRRRKSRREQLLLRPLLVPTQQLLPLQPCPPPACLPLLSPPLECLRPTRTLGRMVLPTARLEGTPPLVHLGLTTHLPLGDTMPFPGAMALPRGPITAHRNDSVCRSCTAARL